MRKAFALALAVLGTTVSAFGAVTVNHSARGWYEIGGENGALGLGGDNYVAGQYLGGSEVWNNYAVFDLSGYTGTATSAKLRYFNPYNGFSSVDAAEVFSLFDVTTPLGNLLGDSNNPATFTDLGSGISYGAVAVTAAANGTYVEISLNPAGLAAVNAALGSDFAVGGSITSLGAPMIGDEFVFGYSNDSAPVELVLTDVTPVPEPASLGALLVAGMLLVRRTRG